MSWLIVIILFTLSGVGYGSDDFYTLIKFSSTWNQYCAVSSSFGSSLASFVSVKTKSRIGASEVLITSTKDACNNKAIQSDSAEIRLRIAGEYPNNGTASETRTKSLVESLKGGPTIGGLKLSSVQFISKSETRTLFSTKAIIIIIGVVVAVYLLGFVCILGIQSDRDRDHRKPQTFVIPYGNSTFDEADDTHFEHKVQELKRDLSQEIR